MKSVMSYPARGPYGDAGWRGNCSGYVIKELIELFKPKLYVDITEGSGTSRSVAREMGVEFVGFDLHHGHDFTADYLLAKLPRPADLVFSHGPYGPAIDYGQVGTFIDPSMIERDTSRCTVEEFLEKSRIMLMNQRECTRHGGHMASLIGDIWHKGRFHSFQADFIKFLPANELRSVCVKIQHNTRCGDKNYSGARYPMLAHEYLIIWQRGTSSMVQMTIGQLKELQRQTSATWQALVRMALIQSGGSATLQDLYEEVERAAGDRVVKNANWKAKVRQILQKYHEPVKRGVWTVSAT